MSRKQVEPEIWLGDRALRLPPILNIMMYDDDTSWLALDPEHLWIFDKLILSRKLGYVCGPVGVDVPQSGSYIVRPVTNLLGMGQQASIVWIEDNTDHLPVGHFWCELFEGRHLSVDYYYSEQVLCVEGFRNKDNPLYKWERWERADDLIPYPTILDVFPYVNCEFVGGKLIEVHLRHNPDFRNGGQVMIPVWNDQDVDIPKGMEYVEDPDFLRRGFYKK